MEQQMTVFFDALHAVFSSISLHEEVFWVEEFWACAERLYQQQWHQRAVISAAAFMQSICGAKTPTTPLKPKAATLLSSANRQTLTQIDDLMRQVLYHV
ncbi:MAG: hypothetical protein MHM6MM_002612 [Cercozoa sp. M6MM]